MITIRPSSNPPCSGQRTRVCRSGPANASVQDRAGGGKSVRQQDQRGQLQLPGGPVPPEKIHQLPPHPELSALNTDCGSLLGLFLDGHRVCSGQNISGGHHPAGSLSAGYWDFSTTDFIRQGFIHPPHSHTVYRKLSWLVIFSFICFKLS